MTGVALMSNDIAVEESTVELEVAEKHLAAPDIVTLTLRATSGEDLPAWTEGAHVDLVLPNGMTRQYSLCSPVDDLSTYRVGVLRDPASRGGSAYIHDALNVGERLTMRGPRNHFEFLPSQHYVFIAGGIGVTPLIPMAIAAQRAGADFEFIYCARSRSAMAFLTELQDQFGDRLIVNADDESGLFNLHGYFNETQESTLVLACGPAPFLDATVRATKNWPSGTVRFERFEPLEVDDSTNVAFEVELIRSGKVLEVPKEKSVLSVLKDNGVRVLSSCTEGTCGSCEVAVLGGDPIDHRDAVLSAEEQASGEMMMVCVSRCEGGRLILDL
ncbi:PDR/VanB family oxidoreductase [Dactylosporangium sp. NPDC051484]|uniref:PDR/VanB family oxidoreductase n=1 Tax=Dactylosporangium sp. NPDC051484 TaxID=3154942 RepID=UPI00344D81C0